MDVTLLLGVQNHAHDVSEFSSLSLRVLAGHHKMVLGAVEIAVNPRYQTVPGRQQCNSEYYNTKATNSYLLIRSHLPISY